MNRCCSTPIPFVDIPPISYFSSDTDSDNSDDNSVEDDMRILPHSSTTWVKFSHSLLQMQTKHKMSADCVKDVLIFFQNVVPSADLPSYCQIHCHQSVHDLIYKVPAGKNEFIIANLEHQLSQIVTRYSSYFPSTVIRAIFFADGASLTKSTKSSFWPILLALIDLPSSTRFHSRNLLLVGIWFYGKPEWGLFLPHIVHSINGVKSLKVNGCDQPFQLKIERMVTDLPARASILQMKQYNGKYSCLYCEIQGAFIDTLC